LGRLLDRDLDHRVIERRWQGTVAHRVEGTPPTSLIDEAARADADHRVVESLAARWVTRVWTLPYRRRRRRQPVWFNAVVAAPWRRAVDEPLSPRLYRVGWDHDSNASK
jgi:hypothetical protein